MTCGFCEGFADQPRYITKFYSADSSFNLSRMENDIWVLKSVDNKDLYKLSDDNFASKTLLISNDGNYIVSVNDNPGSTYPNYNGKENAVTFYFKGKMYSNYTFQDLISDECNISFSVSHFSWLVSKEGFTFKSDSLFITTTEFYDFKFNIKTGQYKREKTLDFGDKAIIFYGAFVKGKSNKISIRVWKYIYPQSSKDEIILCESKRFGSEGKWSSFFIVKDGRDITPYRFWNEIYNNCLISSEY